MPSEQISRSLFLTVGLVVGLVPVASRAADAAPAPAPAPAAAVEMTRPEILLVGGRERLRFDVPVGWEIGLQSDMEETDGSLPAVMMRPAAGPDFRVLVSILLPPDQGAADGEELDDKAMARMARAMLARVQDQAANKLELVALPTPGTAGNKGYKYFAVDPAPRPGEWRNLTQGLVRVGPALLGFTVLTNPGQEAIDAAALRMLEGVVPAPAPASPPGAPPPGSSI